MRFIGFCRVLFAVALVAAGFSAQTAYASFSAEVTATAERGSNLGIIKGVVRDAGGSPISGATVSVIRNSSSKLFRQVAAGKDGSFLLKVLPGSYTLTAVASGFNPVRFLGVEVGRAAQLNYGIKLERAGAGNTMPEGRIDRNSSKWRIRASQINRSIYQNAEGEEPIVDEAIHDDRDASRKGQTIAESYFAANSGGSFAGLNAATLIPVTNDLNVIVAGQTGVGRSAPQRFETTLNYRSGTHNLRFTGSLGRLGILTGTNETLGQTTFQALDEWRVREGIIVVYGIDYSRILGAGGDSAISPRFGLQFDADSKTRVRASFVPQTVERNWTRAMELEGSNFAFAEPVAIEDLAFTEGKPHLNRSSRLEFGIERVLDNRSTVEAAVFFDAVHGRGVGINTFDLTSLEGDAFSEMTGSQQGEARGFRVVYNRRLNGPFSASAGYSYGAGQKLSAAGLTDPQSVFENDIFQSFFAQVSADLRSGTSVRTIYRLSPQATVFAIDPFKGRLAIYDPGLSVYVTQNLPTLGLPIRAEAIIDARNLFDLQTSAASDEGLMRLSSQRRMLMGGIQVRF
jgi:hypothetical protein